MIKKNKDGKKVNFPKNETMAIKQKEAEGEIFLHFSKDFLKEKTGSSLVVGMIFMSLFVVAIFIFFGIAFNSSWSVIKETIIVIIVSILLSLLALSAIACWLIPFYYKKEIKKIKETGYKTIAIIKRFFVYVPYVSRSEASYSLEFQIILPSGETLNQKAASIFAMGQTPWGIQLGYPNIKKLTYDENENYYYIEAGNVKTPIIIGLNKTILFLGV